MNAYVHNEQQMLQSTDVIK